MSVILRYISVIMIFLAVVFITSDVTMAQTNDNNYIDDYTDEESYKEINEILRNNGWKGDDFEQIVSTAASGDTSWNLHLTETIAETITDNRYVILQIIFLSVCAAFSGAIDKNTSDAAMLFISLIMMTLLITVFIDAAATGHKCIKMAIEIYRALCPVFFPAVAYSCGTGSAAAYYEIVLFLMYIVNSFIAGVLFKGNYIYMLLGLADTFGDKEKFGRMCELIKKIIRKAVKGILMFFLGLSGIKSLIIPVSDSLKMSFLFKTVSMIPGLGDSASTVSKTVIGSAVMVKNSIGVAAVIVMLIIVGIPVIKLIVMAVVYQFIAAFLQPVTEKRIVKSIAVLSDGLENLIYMVAVTVVLMCLTMAIICFATNINMYQTG